MIIYIWGIFMTIVGLIVVIGNFETTASGDNSFVEGFIAFFVGLCSIFIGWEMKNGNKCPYCGKAHGPELVNYKIVQRGHIIRENNNRKYEQQIRDNYYKCKFCQKEWVDEGAAHNEYL